MKHTLSATAVACALSMGLAAQTPPAGGAQSTPSADTASKVTVTGCLEKASGSASATATTPATGAPATGGASASAATSSMAKFMLNNAMSGAGASATGTAGAAGTSGTAGAARPSASAYQVDGDEAKLTPHVGHKVEITGTVASAKSGADSTATSASGAGAAPRLKVEAVKMIAASCTP